jgi:DNA-binding beta-propeller fold protein YncE
LVSEALTYPPTVNPPSCTNCVVGTITIGSDEGSDGNGIAFDSANGELFVSSSDLGTWGAQAINGSTDTTVGFFSDNGRPLSLAYDARNGDIYLANFIGNDLAVFDANTLAPVDMIPLPTQSMYGGPTGVIYDPFNGAIDVVEMDPAYLVEIDGNTNGIASYSDFGVANDVIAANPSNGELYAATGWNPWNPSLTNFTLDLLNGSSLSSITSMKVDGIPWSITYDSGDGLVYVGSAVQGSSPGSSKGLVTEVNEADTSVEGEVTVGDWPCGLSYDIANENLYVANCDTQTVFVVNSTTNVVTGSISVLLRGTVQTPIVYDSANRCEYVVEVEGLLSILAPTGSTCPSIPVPVAAMNALLVLSSAGLVGTLLALGAYTYLTRDETYW